jgi:hypothetical protein
MLIFGGMKRKANFENLDTAQVSRTQSRRIRLEPDGKQQEQRSLIVIYDKQKNNYLFDLISGEIWNRETYTWDPQADYAGQLFYTVDNQLFSPLGEVEVKDKKGKGKKAGGGYSGDYIFLEAYLHYQFGRRKILDINTSSLNMDGINMRTPEIRNIVKQGSGYINLFKYMKNQTGLAIGSVKLNYLGNNTFSLSRDYYDFDIRWNEGNTGRNWATFGAGLLHGPVIDNYPLPVPISPFLGPSVFFGGPYWINFHGTITLKP